MNYLSVTQFCEKFHMDGGRVRLLISQGRIPAVKIGNQWAIPADTQPPADKRVKNGKYAGWRKSHEKRQREKGCTSQSNKAL